MKETLWQNTCTKKHYPSLSEEKNVDLVIIGGGITGISLAYHLRNWKKKVILLDQGEFCHGVTMRTTGKLNLLQDVFSKIITTHDFETAKLYYQSQQEAIKILKDQIEKHHIKCDFVKTKSYLFSKNPSKQKDFDQTKKIIKEAKEDSFGGVPAISLEDNYVFHPLKYLTTLLDLIEQSSIELYENTQVISYAKENGSYQLKTNRNPIHTKQIVFAGHYPFFLFPYLFPLKATLEKSLIGVIPHEEKSFQAINLDQPTHSIRFHQDQQTKKSYLLYLSESHTLGSHEQGKLEQELSEKIATLFQTKPIFTWSNYDIMTLDGMPYIGSLEPNFFMATGYNTWGMTNGILAGKILHDLLVGRKNAYTDLFDPHRHLTLPMRMLQLIDNLHQAKTYVKSKLLTPKSNEPITIATIKGTKCGIYQDEKKEKHIVTLTCPHMKCGLTWNASEKVWECPCHGSRFDIDGNPLKGPSTTPITFSSKSSTSS